jgi:hypothetical protein
LSLDLIGQTVEHGAKGVVNTAVFGFGLGVGSTIPFVGNLAVGGFLPMARSLEHNAPLKSSNRVIMLLEHLN